MASVNQTRPHCVNQLGKTHSKHLAARRGRGTAWARHAMCESAFMGTSVIVEVVAMHLLPHVLGWIYLWVCGGMVLGNRLRVNDVVLLRYDTVSLGKVFPTIPRNGVNRLLSDKSSFT